MFEKSRNVKQPLYEVMRIVLSNNGGGARKNVYFANQVLEEIGIKTTTFFLRPQEPDEYTSSNLVPFDYRHDLISSLSYALKRRNNSNFVVTLHLKNAIIIFGLIFILFQVPYSCVIHQDIEQNTLRQKLTNKIYLFVLKRSRFNIAISSFIHKKLKRFKVDSFLLNNASEYLGDFSEDKNIRNVGVVGELVKRKGIMDCDEIAAMLDPSFVLNIYGKGKLLDDVQKFKFTKYQGYKDIKTILSEVDILLFLSYNEPFGRVVTEFMSAGLPVLVRNSGEPPNIVGDVRQVFEDINEIPAALKSIEINRAEIVARNIAKYNQKYSLEAYKSFLVEIYSEYFRKLN